MRLAPPVDGDRDALRTVTKSSRVRNVVLVPETEPVDKIDVRGIITEVVGTLTSVTTLIVLITTR